MKCAVLMLLAVLPSSLPAQERPRAAELLSAFASPHSGRPVRVRLRDGAMVAGRFVALDQNALRLATADGEKSLAPEGIDTAWVGRAATRRGIKMGAIAGGIAGMGTGAYYIGTVVHNTCETDDCDSLEAALVGGLLGGAIGALGGGLIGGIAGALATEWRRVYPDPGVR